MDPFTAGIHQQAFQLGATYINKTINSSRCERIRRYFQIENGYLLGKLLLILYPYSSLKWRSTSARDGVSVPLFFPDLYIPFMGIITYILVMAGELEIKGNFKPEALGKLFTKTTLIDILEVLLIKAISFFFRAEETELLDLLSFLGYKYVPLIVHKLVSSIANAFLRKLLWLYLLVSSLFFLGKSLKYFIISDNALIEVKKKRMYYVFCILLIDAIVMVLLK